MRRDGWFEELKRVVAAHETAKWERGKRDCATFVADCMVAIGCEDAMADLRGEYGSMIQLIKRVTALGHRGPVGYMADWCASKGYPEIDPMFAQCGDVGITSNGICAVRMPQGFIAMGESGGIGLVNPCKAWAIEWA